MKKYKLQMKGRFQTNIALSNTVHLIKDTSLFHFNVSDLKLATMGKTKEGGTGSG